MERFPGLRDRVRRVTLAGCGAGGLVSVSPVGDLPGGLANLLHAQLAAKLVHVDVLLAEDGKISEYAGAARLA